MELIENLPLEMLTAIFHGEARTDLIRIVIAAFLYKELRGTRKGLEAVVKRVDNHEGRILTLEGD